MRSRTLIVIALGALGASLAGCATPEAKALCYPVSGWASPALRCGSASASTPAVPVAAPEPAAAPVAVATPPPEPVKPEPEPEPAAPPPKAEMKTASIELSETVQFETDSSVLLDRSKTLLDEVVQAMNDHPEVRKVLIEGYTDAVASKTHNQKLSEQRVASVKAYLIAKGVEANRLKTKGFGETHPLASNKTEEGRAKNRRVEFKVIDRKKGKGKRK
jgi:outer membrane protein OmpA-like peptidoglycan-associated protein